MIKRPLEGVRILDLTRVLAGPFCTMILGDLGAEVVKVEMPGTGDDARHFGPFKNGKSLYFVSINRDKKSISLNLKTEKGKQIFKQLLPKFDVVIENFRPGTMEKLGLGYDVLKELHPALIYAASSGFGHTGPLSSRPSYDILAQAMGGIMSITGWPDTPPTRVGMSLGDITASLYTAIGITSALYQRTLTGTGQKIDISMLDCQLSILENALARFQVEGKSPQPIGNRHPTITPFQAFRANDGYFVVAVGNDNLWRAFCSAIELEHLAEDERFLTNGLRTQNLEELVAVLSPVFEQKSTNEWLEIIEKAKVPCAPINTIEKLFDDEQLNARNMFVSVDDKHAGKIKIAGNPLKMTNVPEVSRRNPAPDVGEHNVELLSSLPGMDEESIRKLKDEGVI
ncbi:MAG: CaiB/BaiF CoA-transferase family protein [Bacteroidales bacterium]|nr:CaiB/BaiF CoA-transferase family protein [Bacteroidales bacterium]